MRVAAHVCDCRHHSAEIREKARALVGRESTGAKADDVRGKEGDIADLWRKRSDADYKLIVDDVIIKFVCGLGIPPYAVDSKWFKDFIEAVTCSRYDPVSGTTLAESHIVGEAARVRELTIKYLKSDKVTWITFSFNAGSIRSRRSFLTIHATDQERQAHFLGAENTTGLDHTAELYSERVLTVIKEIGAEKAVGVISDNMGNTQKARRLICQNIGNIVDMQDVCHLLHNTVKDICKLKYFAQTISKVQAIVQFFSQSDKAAIKLSNELVRQLEKFSNTWFGATTWVFISVIEAWASICKLVSSGEITIQNKALDSDDGIFMENSFKSMLFRERMAEFVNLTNPLARAILCLESPHTSPADILIFVAAALIMYKRTFMDLTRDPIPGTSPPVNQIASIITSRYKELIDSKNGHDAYFTCMLLHPAYLGSDVLKQPNPLLLTLTISNTRPAAEMDGRYPCQVNDTAYKCAAKFLYDLLGKLRRSKRFPRLMAIPSTVAFNNLEKSFDTYTRGMWPFSNYDSKIDPRTWWSRLANEDSAFVLAFLAEYLFLLTPNSMAEERTMSGISWINSPRRSRQKISTVVNQVMICQYYGFDPKAHTKRAEMRPTLRFSTLKDYRVRKYAEEDSEGEDSEGENNDDNSIGEDMLPVPQIIGSASAEMEKLVEALGGLNFGSQVLQDLLDSPATRHFR